MIQKRRGDGILNPGGQLLRDSLGRQSRDAEYSGQVTQGEIARDSQHRRVELAGTPFHPIEKGGELELANLGGDAVCRELGLQHLFERRLAAADSSISKRSGVVTPSRRRGGDTSPERLSS